MLVIHCNNNFRPEREYILSCIFHDFWQVDYEIKYEKRSDIEIEFADMRLYVADTFLQMREDDWLTLTTLPQQPLAHVMVPEEYDTCVTDRDLPVIYGGSSAKLFAPDDRHCTLDIFGSALFMLTRYEEVVKKERDALDRFSAMDSLAYQEGFLERPIINEYLEILWQWLSNHFPELKRKERQFAIMPTHDVDNPFWSLGVNWYHRGRMLAGDILKRRDFSLAKEHLGYIANAVSGKYAADPHNTFDMIMDISEEHNLTSHFYFMTAQGRDDKDGNYDIMHPEVRKLACRMMERGHKIGIHPGFGSKDTAQLIKNDTDRLRRMIAAEKIPVDSFGGRQHYLHWSAPHTWQYYEQAGIIYDTTLSYADHIGFRCGICYEYPVYNVATHEQYSLHEYPLAVMECSGLAERYMNLSYEEMLKRCRVLKDKVKKYQGIFVILWHNTSFMTEDDVVCYRGILA